MKLQQSTTRSNQIGHIKNGNEWNWTKKITKTKPHPHPAVCLFACQSKQWHDQTHHLWINTEEKGIKTNVINNIEDMWENSQSKPF